jgi:phage head maturation protease
MMEHRSNRGGVRAKPEGIVTVRAVSYNTLDDYMTVFAPGCATDSLNRRLPVFAASHSWDLRNTLGRGISWRDTLQGPEITMRLDLHDDVPLARQALIQIQSGTLTDISIGFSTPAGGKRSPTASERARWPGVETIYTKIEIDECSLVLRGAVGGSQVLAVRSRTPRDDLLDEIDDAIRAAARAAAPVDPAAARRLRSALKRVRP